MDVKREKPVVLIIDDEMQMRFYLMTLVKSLNYEPVMAKNGVEGLDKLHQAKPDIIILDIMMPEKGGALVYQEMLANPACKHIPILFFTGVDQKAFFHHIRMLNAAMGDKTIPEPEYYIAKDTDPEYFKTVIKTCVEKTRKSFQKTGSSR